MAYFKIPIEKVAGEIQDPSHERHGQSIHFNVSQQAMVDGLEANRFWVHIAARRTGKSYAASIAAFAKLLEPNQQVTVVAPNYNLSGVIWEYVTTFIRSFGLDEEAIKLSEKDKVVRLVNNSVFRLFSAVNRDSLVGRAANLLIIDEAAVITDDEFFRRDLRPSLSTFPDSRALFITTPRGKANYIYDYYMRGQDADEYSDWGSAVFTCESNPYLMKADIKEAEKTMAHNLFRQEYYCEWSVYEGQIFSIKEDEHLVDLSDIEPKDPRYDFIGGLDIGYRDETAFVVLATDGERYFVVDQYVNKEATTSVHAHYIKELEEKWGIDNIYIDSAAAQARSDLAYEYDIYCDNAIKSVEDGIAYVQNLVEKDLLLFDINNAYDVFGSMGAYRWNLKTERQKPVHDEHSHLCDAIRYAIYSHHNNQVDIYSLAY